MEGQGTGEGDREGERESGFGVELCRVCKVRAILANDKGDTRVAHISPVGNKQRHFASRSAKSRGGSGGGGNGLARAL